MNKQKKLYVITAGSYPYGGAATNRHLSYLKGLTEYGVEISMIILQPDYLQSKLSNKNKGIYNAIAFEYILPINHKSNGIIAKIINRKKSVKDALNLISNSLDSSKDNRLLVLLTDAFSIQPFITFSKKSKIKIYHERTEYPTIGISGFRKKLTLKVYLRMVNRFDGVFVITKSLIDYFKKYVDADKLFHLPMTVEPERFDCKTINSISSYGKYIAYCGSMYTDKDGVPILIEAFDILATTVHDVNLLLIGDNSNESNFAVVQNKIKKAENKERIFLTGKIERDQMPEYLCNAAALALARPDNIQAKGGFPTKLGEYLATGNPIVVTAVGEIPDYLTNQVNAYVTNPDSPKDFAKALKVVFDNPDKAKQIGLQGKLLSHEVFNYKVQAERLSGFIFK